MIPSDTNSISWDQLMILGDRILSPRITHTKVTIEPHFVLKSGIKGSQKFLGVRKRWMLTAAVQNSKTFMYSSTVFL